MSGAIPHHAPQVGMSRSVATQVPGVRRSTEGARGFASLSPGAPEAAVHAVTLAPMISTARPTVRRMVPPVPADLRSGRTRAAGTGPRPGAMAP
ncbi:hypothetical protein TBS_31870 [Thermobispora bispora]